MSELVDLYNKTQKPRVVEARNIPNQEVNFIDRQNEFQQEYDTNRKVGDETNFTEKAMQYYDAELTNVVIPPSFKPQGDATDPISLNRYSPKTPFYTPGQPSE